LEQIGGLAMAVYTVIRIFFSVCSYRKHEVNVLKEYERILNEDQPAGGTKAHSEVHCYFGI